MKATKILDRKPLSRKLSTENREAGSGKSGNGNPENVISGMSSMEARERTRGDGLGYLRATVGFHRKSQIMLAVRRAEDRGYLYGADIVRVTG